MCLFSLALFALPKASSDLTRVLLSMSINKRLKNLATPMPKSVHFLPKFPQNVCLQWQAPPTARGGPDSSFLERFKLSEFPFDIDVELDQAVLDHAGVASSLIVDKFLRILLWNDERPNDERPNEEEETETDEEDDESVEAADRLIVYRTRNPYACNWLHRRKKNRTGSVPLGGIMVLTFSLLTTFSVEDVVSFLKPHLIGFAKSAAPFVWHQADQWSSTVTFAVANSFAPHLHTHPVISFICHRLPPKYIALLPQCFIVLLPPSIIERLPHSCIERLPSACIETLSPSCIETLSPTCIKTLSTSFIARLPRSFIDRLSLPPGTHMEVQLIILQRMVDGISLRFAVLVPWIPVPFVTYVVRFGISFAFWSLSLALWRLLQRIP